MRNNVNDRPSIKTTGNIAVSPAVVISKKIQVYKVMPEKLKLAIDNLGLSNIMKNKAVKLVCLIINAGMEKNHNLATYIPLPTKYLEKIFNKEYHTDFFNSLKSNNIIECNEVYKHGSIFKRGFSKGYRISQELLNGEFVSTSYQDNKLNNDQDGYIEVYRTYFHTSPDSTSTQQSPDTSSISSTHTTPINSSTYQSTTSSIMHIPTRLFEKSLIYDDLSSLFYDEAKIWEVTEAKISIISTRLFKIDQDVLRNFFEVSNHINGLTYYTTRDKAIKWCKDNGVTLIQDGKYFYIDDLDRYLLLKKRNLLLNYKWFIAKLTKKIFYANINLSNVYYVEQKYRQAVDLGLKAVAVKPDYVNCYANLGRYYLALGRPDSGIYYTSRGIAIDPNYGFNYKIMAFCFKALGNTDSVRKYVGLAQKTMPDFKM